MFSKDISHYRATPRTLQTSKFGAYSRLHVPGKRSAQGWFWAIGYGVAVGVFLWVVLLVKVGS